MRAGFAFRANDQMHPAAGAGLQSDDPAVRAPIYRRANRLMLTDFPYIPVYEGRRLIVASDDLREYRPNMTATPWWNAWQWDI